MRERVTEINRIRDEQAKVINIEERVEKAEGLKGYVRSDVYEAQQIALSELAKCGPSALNTIRQMLDDPDFADEAAALIKVFADAGGEAVGGELNSRLQKELLFWQTTGALLPQGWWNQDATAHAPLRERYQRTHELVLGLEHTNYAPAAITATRLRDIWLSLPQLNDSSSINEMAEECQKLAEHLQAK